MGPSVKFVSPNKGLISKKNGGPFFVRKNDQTGRGPRGVWQKTILFPICFSEPFPKLPDLYKGISNMFQN